MNGRRGSVLILSLWVLSTLSVFSISLGYGARQKATLLARLQTQTALDAVAFAGVAKASGLLRQLKTAETPYDDLNSEWANNAAYFKQISAGVGICEVSAGGRPGLEDENAKLPLNTADAAMLARLLKLAAGVTPEQAEAISYAIVDWRDADSALSHPQLSAEDSDYSDLDLPYEAKDAPFQVIDELLLVKGMTRPIFDKIKSTVTPYNTTHVNIHTAPAEVLVALGIEEKLAERIKEYCRGSDEEAGTADDGFFQSIDKIVPILSVVLKLEESEMASVSALVSKGQLGTTSNFFTAVCRARLDNGGAEIDLEAGLDKEGNILYMRRGRVQWPA